MDASTVREPGKPPPTIQDCWNKIGVRGDGSCVELAKYAHCRNCPVYSAAAVSLLDRNLPVGYAAERTEHFAARREVEETDTHSAVIFRIGTEWFALSTLAFDEIVSSRTIRSLPHRRHSGIVLGLINVRGELIVCVALDKILGQSATNRAAPTPDGSRGERLIVLRHDSGRIAFPVDEVQITHRYHQSELKAAPATLAKAAANHTIAVLRWKDRMVGCLDDQLLIQTINRSLA